MSNTTARCYTLRTENGQWLGQIVLTSNGMFSSVTDYENFSCHWSQTGMEDFRKFIIGLDTQYFGGKIYQGITYFAYGRKFEQSCQRFAERILPELQKALKEEIATEANLATTP